MRTLLTYIVATLLLAAPLSVRAEDAAAAASSGSASATAGAASATSPTTGGDEAKHTPKESGDPKAELSENEKAVSKIAERLIRDGGSAKLTPEEEKQLKEMDGADLSKILQSDQFKNIFKAAGMDEATMKSVMGQVQRVLSAPNEIARNTMAPILAAQAASEQNAASTTPAPLNGTTLLSQPAAPIIQQGGFVPPAPSVASSNNDVGSGFSGGTNGLAQWAAAVSALPVAPAASGGSTLNFNEASPNTTINAPQLGGGVTISAPAQVSAAPNNNAPIYSPGRTSSQPVTPDPDYLNKIMKPAETTVAANEPTRTTYGDSGFVWREPAPVAPTEKSAAIVPAAPTVLGAQSDATSSGRTSDRKAIVYSDASTPAESRKRTVDESSPVELTRAGFKFNWNGAVESVMGAQITFEVPRSSETIEVTEAPVRRQGSRASTAAKRLTEAAQRTLGKAAQEGLNISFSEEVPASKGAPASVTKPAKRELTAAVLAPHNGYAAKQMALPFTATTTKIVSGLAPTGVLNPTVSPERAPERELRVVATATDSSTALNKLLNRAQAAQ